MTILHNAALLGNISSLPEEVINNVDMWKEKDSTFGQTPLHFAAWRGNLDQVPGHIKEIPEVWGEKDRFGRTPIYYAATTVAKGEENDKK